MQDAVGSVLYLHNRDQHGDDMRWNGFLIADSDRIDMPFLYNLNKCFRATLGEGNMLAVVSPLAEDGAYISAFGGHTIPGGEQKLAEAIQEVYGLGCEDDGIIVFLHPAFLGDLKRMFEQEGNGFPCWHFIHWAIVNSFANTSAPDHSLRVTLASVYVVAAALPVADEMRTKIVDTSVTDFLTTFLGERLRIDDLSDEEIMDFDDLEEGVSDLLLAIKHKALRPYALDKELRTPERLAEEIFLLKRDVLTLSKAGLESTDRGRRTLTP